jgi:hypothetical protein
MSQDAAPIEKVEDVKGYLDQVQEKAVSRKFLVFIVATVMLGFGWNIDADTWGWIALAYMGTQGVIDAMKAYRR